MPFDAMAVAASRITAIGDATAVRSPTRADAAVVDLAGSHVMSGLLDTHNHHEMAGRSILLGTLSPSASTSKESWRSGAKRAETTPIERRIADEPFGSQHLERMSSWTHLSNWIKRA